MLELKNDAAFENDTRKRMSQSLRVVLVDFDKNGIVYFQYFCLVMLGRLLGVKVLEYDCRRLAILTFSGGFDKANATTGWISPKSSLFSYFELSVICRVSEAVGNKKTTVRCLLVLPRRRPDSVKSIHIQSGISGCSETHRTGTRSEGPSRKRRRPRLGGSLHRG